MEDQYAGLKALGSSKATEYKDTYAPEVLERFENRLPHVGCVVEIDCPEFTALCPKTGQPDFAKITIQYIPDKWLVESKSLKLYLFSFRRHGAFHEDAVRIIAHDLDRLMEPTMIQVTGEFYPRGGISINPVARIERPKDE